MMELLGNESENQHHEKKECKKQECFEEENCEKLEQKIGRKLIKKIRRNVFKKIKDIVNQLVGKEFDSLHLKGRRESYEHMTGQFILHKMMKNTAPLSITDVNYKKLSKIDYEELIEYFCDNSEEAVEDIPWDLKFFRNQGVSEQFIALKMIEYGHEEILIEHIGKFTDLDQDVLDYLFPKGMNMRDLKNLLSMNVKQFMGLSPLMGFSPHRGLGMVLYFFKRSYPEHTYMDFIVPLRKYVGNYFYLILQFLIVYRKQDFSAQFILTLSEKMPEHVHTILFNFLSPLIPFCSAKITKSCSEEELLRYCIHVRIFDPEFFLKYRALQQSAHEEDRACFQNLIKEVTSFKKAQQLGYAPNTIEQAKEQGLLLDEVQWREYEEKYIA